MATSDFGTINAKMDYSVIYCIQHPAGPPKVDRTRKLVGTPPNGYMGSYQYPSFCDSVATEFNAQTGNGLVFSKKWKDDHIGESVEGFIAEATIEAVTQAKKAGIG